MGADREEEAERLAEAGWRQGSLFEPNEWIGVPEGGDETALLVVVTQTCSLLKAPRIEVAAATPVAKHRPRSREANGRNFSKLLVAVNADTFKAVEISAHARAFHPRESFLKFRPGEAEIGQAEARKIGDWLGRCYSRVALPDNLVILLKQTCLPALTEVLSAKEGDGRMADGILAIYIDWEPDEELGPFKVTMTVLTVDQATAEEIDRTLCEAFPIAHDGLEAALEVLSMDATLISDVHGRVRFTEWDYLTTLGEEAA